MNDSSGSPEIRDLLDFDLGNRTCSYSEKDAILFALSVGARADELRWVYEKQLEVMPTFAMTLGLWAVRAAGAIGAYDPVETLHAGQRLVVHRPLPSSATIEMEGGIAAVWDKGAAALIEVLVRSEYFDATYSIFVPNGGGFGGSRGSSIGHRNEVQGEAWRSELETSTGQAVLYRLTGDLHPVHIDPEVALANGFERPILHGLCTLSAVAKTVADVGADLGAMKELNSRFSAPVYPGDTITVLSHQRGNLNSFTAETTGTLVLKDGWIEF
jgi:acyl dehydratase